jgi:hypothetical protein
MFRSYDHLQAGGHKTETCSGYWIKYANQCCVRRKPWTWRIFRYFVGSHSYTKTMKLQLVKYWQKSYVRNFSLPLIHHHILDNVYRALQLNYIPCTVSSRPECEKENILPVKTNNWKNILLRSIIQCMCSLYEVYQLIDSKVSGTNNWSAGERLVDSVVTVFLCLGSHIFFNSFISNQNYSDSIS